MAHDYKTHGLQYRSTRITIPYGLQFELNAKAGRVKQEKAQQST